MTKDEQEAVLAWISRFCKARSLDWRKLSPVQQDGVLRAIPCTIRCWRVGEPCDVSPGENCPECGRPVPKNSTFLRHLDNPLV